MHNYNVEDDVFGFRRNFDATQLGYQEDTEFTCYDGDTIPLDNVNDGWDDCYSGEDEDEYDNGITTPTSVRTARKSPLSWSTTTSADCADASDEPVDNDGDWFLCETASRFRSSTSTTASQLRGWR